MTASLAEIQRAMIAEIRSSEGDGVYRTLVRRGLAEILRVQLPRTAALLGDRWAGEVARLLDDDLPRSRYVRDTAFPFVARAAARWSSDPDLPPFLVDVARWELLDFEVKSAPDDGPIEPGALALDRRVALSLSARVARFSHAVHLLSDDEASIEPPAPIPVTLCVFRDRDMDVSFLELTPSAAEILDRLARGEALGEAVSGAAKACDLPLDATFLKGAAGFLEDLSAHGVVRGPAPIDTFPSHSAEDRR